ncbi:hypothetical protein A9Q86_06595 [Flavobacteriales bacterium 33_180_T64]|nr:hypothetical protein A9Q86_06595 [Flavobacteriales bacterium 33_180_T64]
MMNVNQIKIALLLLFVPMLAIGQLKELSLFENLVDKTWCIEGEWKSGTAFKQEVRMKYDLQGTLVVVETKGFVDEEQTELGNRNHGIRQYDGSSKTIKFWEFDAFGNLTKGTVFAEDKNIVYQYYYEGEMLTEMWEYVDDSTYNFKIGSYIDGRWSDVYIDSVFKEKK